jgi:hypothetical protein
MTPVDWSFNSSGEVPDDPNCSGATCPHYINFVDQTREVRANPNVKAFEFRVDSFDTETGYDFLKWRQKGGADQHLTGTPATGWYGTVVNENLQSTPMELQFITDFSVTRPGFRIGQARVCCAASTNREPANIPLLRRNTGVLLGNGDVVLFKAPALPAGQKLNVILWGGTGADFDLYVRCNAWPTQSTFDYLGFSGNSQEFLSFDGSACTSPGTWYIAVHSYSGSGQFNLMVSPMFAAQERTSVTVGTNFNATPDQLNGIANALRGSGRQFYGQTEGQFLVRQFELFNNTGPSCESCGGQPCIICFKNQPGTGYCCDGSQYVINQSYWFDPEGIAHEYGHGYLAIWDEYEQGTSRSQCGHSNMSFPWGSNNNHCQSGDHKKDKNPSASDTGQPSAWGAGIDPDRLPLTNVSGTPDNTDFRDHDFNGLIEVLFR